MRENWASVAAVAVAGCLSVAAAVGALSWWLTREASVELVPRLPQAVDPRRAAKAGPATRIEGQFRKYDGTPGRGSERWPRFRGSGFDNVCGDGVPLGTAWGESGPPVLWSVDLGEGHAGPAVLNGRVYVLDYDEETQSDALRCFSMRDGRELWRRWYQVRVKRNHGMSRTVPAVTEKFALTVGPKCHVMCCNAVTGAFLWGIDMVREFESTVPLWYTAQCPLIDGDVAVLAPGGSALLVGVACDTGRVLWQTPNPRGWRMSHSSVMPMTVEGRRMFVYAAVGGVVGVASDGDDVGTVLWESLEWDHTVVAPSPVMLGGGRIALTAGYGAGSMILQVVESASGYEVRTIVRLDREVFACEQQTPIFHDDHLFTVLPNDAGAHRRQLVCMRPDGVVVWRSGKTDRFGLGPFMVADGKILVLDDAGYLTAVRATSARYERLARARVVGGRDPWGPMAAVDGKLLLRDSKRMVCLDLRAGGRTGHPVQGGDHDR